jgi:hypothetical protein
MISATLSIVCCEGNVNYFVALDTCMLLLSRLAARRVNLQMVLPAILRAIHAQGLQVPAEADVGPFFRPKR